MPKDIDDFVRRSAGALGIPMSRFQNPNNTVDNILAFFNNGRTPTNVVKDALPVKFVRPRLIEVGGGLFAVEAVYRSRNPIVPAIAEAWVGFSGKDVAEVEVPPWRELTGQEDIENVPKGLSFNFTSVLTFNRNMVEFAQDVLSPLHDDRRRADLSAVTERWLRENS